MSLRWVFFALFAVNLWLLLQVLLHEPEPAPRLPPLAYGTEDRTPAPANLSAPGARMPTSDPAPPAADASDAEASAPVQSSAQRDAGCWQVGPYLRREDLSRMLRRIAAAGYAAEVSEREFDAEPDYLVHSAPEPSKAGALRLQGRFAALAVDTHVIGAGPYRNAVSFGVFSTRERAEALRVRLDRDGVTANVAPLARRRSGYFISVDGAAAMPAESVDAQGKFAPLVALRQEVESAADRPQPPLARCEP